MSDAQLLDELINQPKTKRVDEPLRQYVKPEDGRFSHDRKLKLRKRCYA